MNFDYTNAILQDQLFKDVVDNRSDEASELDAAMVVLSKSFTVKARIFDDGSLKINPDEDIMTKLKRFRGKNVEIIFRVIKDE